MSQTEPRRTSEGSPGGADSGRIASLLRLFGPTTFLTGLLYYYGYVSLKAYYAYFGISLSALDLSSTDYLVRSPDTLFRPIATLMVILIVGFVIHHLLAHLLMAAEPRIARRVALSVAAASAVLAGVAWLGVFVWPNGVASPISLVVAALLFEYGLGLLTRYGAPSPRL